jgi:hypothetical protein
MNRRRASCVLCGFCRQSEAVQVLPTSAVSSFLPASLVQPAVSALNLLGRLAQAGQMPALGPLPQMSGGTLTAEMVRAALLELGAAAADTDVALALALTQAGQPLTLAALAEANAALASAPGVSPDSYVLARSLSLPVTPDSLRALSATLAAPSGAPAALPARVSAWLGLALDAGAPPPALARDLREMVLQAGRSTEHRLLAAKENSVPVADLRTSLLRLAAGASDREMRLGADHLASLLEGQQLLNQASLTAHVRQPHVPLYFALPPAFDGLLGMAEMQLWRQEKDADISEEAEALRVTVRLHPPKLGRVQADLTGLLAGVLSCRLGAEKPATVRLLTKSAGSLAEALSAAGWGNCDVTCRVQQDWPPLYHGGAAFASPRTCVDHHV